jgi:multicomponent Na+:H+ antiporter subunit B
MQRILSAAVVILFAMIFASIAIGYSEQQALRPLAESYVKLVPHDLGAPNVVSGILLAFRAFDTLGEVTALFMAAVGVGMVLRGPGRAFSSDVGDEAGSPASEIVRTSAQILIPIMSIFAAYIILNGHISAGGGFQGGAIIASATLLFMLARPARPINVAFLSITESIAGVLFVLVGVAGLVFAGGFLDTRFLPVGEFGALFSAGAIPVLSVLLGVKVGCELSVLVDRFRS